jgi:hypothetical protein
VKEYTKAAFCEACRLFPPAMRLAKNVVGETSLKAHRFTTNHDGKVQDIKEYTVPIKSGSVIIIDILALHMNCKTPLMYIWSPSHVPLSNLLG